MSKLIRLVRTGLRDCGRREFLASALGGLSGAALASLLTGDGFSPTSARADDSQPQRTFDLLPHKPHFAPTARAVIHILADGGPSQVDLFDPKPELDRSHGKAIFQQIAEAVSGPRNAGTLMRSPFKFAQYGQSGLWLSEMLPHLQAVADEIAVIRSMHTPSAAHPAAQTKTHTGRLVPGAPALGSWVVYGLGSESRSLPAYVALDDSGANSMTAQYYHSGWLPPVCQATRLRPTGTPVLNLQPSQPAPDRVARLQQELLAELDAAHRRERPAQLALDARIASYELAAQMQLHASAALDLSSETQQTQKLYGLDNPATESCARKLLMARRLVERGVRFVQIFTGGWDNHNNLERDLRSACTATDQPVAALLRDMRRRGLLESTLVLWGGEFGRLPIAQVPESNSPSTVKVGRDHGPRGYSVWLAGGGIKGGTAYGTTDEIGFAAAENPVSIADWHATILHCLGLDYHELTYLRDGLADRLTGVGEARVVREILA